MFENEWEQGKNGAYVIIEQTRDFHREKLKAVVSYGV